MIDLKAARNDPDAYRAALERKGAGEPFDALLAADERWRALVPAIDELRGKTKLKGKPSPEQLAELQQVKEQLRAAEEEYAAAEAARDELLAQVPNPPHESVPDGAEEEDAVEISRSGEPPELAEAREHTEVGRFDMERAARLSGSRFGYLIGDTALVAFALYRAALAHLAENGFTPVLPPVLVREEAMTGTGFFPTERSNIYALADDDLYLTGTSEVALAGLHMGEIIPAEELPLRYAGFSTNFRREAGAAGKDTRGMFRVHQFNKVEMFVYTTDAESWAEHERMLALEEAFVAEARAALPRRQRRRRRPRRVRGEEVRHRGVVSVAGALPRDHVVLEHDRLPVAPARHPRPWRGWDRAAAHAQRDDGHRPGAARDPGELPGRCAGCARRVRRPRARLGLSRTALLASACLLLAGCGGSESDADGSWETAPPLLHPRSAHAVVTDGHAVYALGGTGSNGEPVLSVERFDGERWTEETTLPGEGLNAPAAAVLHGRIYVIGGFGTTTNVATPGVHVYDLVTRTWSEAAPLPAARGGHAAVVLDGKIHVVGGGNEVSTLALHSVYDATADRWTEAAPLPRSKGSPAAVVLDGMLWAIGGRSGPDDYGNVDVYDPAADTWSSRPSIPPRGTHGAAVYGDAIYVFGGESQQRGAVLAGVLRLDPASAAWTKVDAALPTPRAYARAVPFGDGVLVIGGSTSAGASHASEGSPVVERFSAEP